MSLADSISKKISTLKHTVTTVYSSNGEVHEEIRDQSGCLCKTKLNTSAPGFVVDQSPDLSISHVLSWLWLGSQDVAHDHSLLKKHGITHILSIGVPCPQYDDITTVFVEAYDLAEFRITDIFERCFHAINTARANSGIIYVHCNAGVSRSATVVAGYLMQHKKIGHVEALGIVKSVRPKINPNPGFVKQLEEFASENKLILTDHKTSSNTMC